MPVNNKCEIRIENTNWLFNKYRAETRTLIGGGGVYSYIHVLPEEFLFKLINLNFI